MLKNIKFKANLQKQFLCYGEVLGSVHVMTAVRKKRLLFFLWVESKL